MTQEIESKVTALIAAALGIERAAIRPGSSPTGELGADSLQLVELIVSLEVEFHLDIPDEDAAEFRTVEQVVEYVMIALAVTEPPFVSRSNRSMALSPR
jgi:acyl carrier protein